MIGGSYTAFVLTQGNMFCKFGSYSTVRFVDSPLKATLYTRERDARKRADEAHYADTQVAEWIGPGEFTITRITVVVDNEEDVS